MWPWDAPPGLRPTTDPVRRPRLARDVLRDRDGTQCDQRDRHREGAHAVAGQFRARPETHYESARVREEPLATIFREARNDELTARDCGPLRRPRPRRLHNGSEHASAGP